MIADESRKGRRLSSDDIEIWDGVTRSVRPLRKRKPAVATPTVTEAAPVAAKATQTVEAHRRRPDRTGGSASAQKAAPHCRP